MKGISGQGTALGSHEAVPRILRPTQPRWMERMGQGDKGTQLGP